VSSVAGKPPGSANTLYAGTSGFSYATWKGTFYPPGLSGSKMLAYYAKRLNGVELNGSFYHTPPETALLKWSAETPPGFRFCMKANRGLTYSAEGFDRVGLARILGQRVAPLGERLGPIFLQFPPAYYRLRRGYTNASLRPWVAEVRSALSAHDDVHVYFKHDPEAPALAQRMLSLAARESAPRPAR
jgi:uncharacterized protein YecE (DUF72 family)